MPRRDYLGRYESYRGYYETDETKAYATREEVEAALAAGTTDFRSATLAGLRLNGLDFSNCDFTYADLSDSRLSSTTNLRGAIFHETRMIGTNAENVDFTVAASLHHMQCQDALLRYAIFEGMDLSRSDFTHANLFSANFQRADVRSTRFEHAALGYVRFQGANLEGAAFGQAELHHIEWTGARVDKSSHEVMAALILAAVERDERQWGQTRNQREAITRHKMIAGLVLLEPSSCWREIGGYLGALDGPTAEADRLWLHDVFEPFRELGLGSWIDVGDRAYRINLAEANEDYRTAEAVRLEAERGDEDYDPDLQDDEDEDDPYGDDEPDEDEEPDADEDEDEEPDEVSPEVLAAEEAAMAKRLEWRQRAEADSSLGMSDTGCNCYLCRADRARRAEEAREAAAAEAAAAAAATSAPTTPEPVALSEFGLNDPTPPARDPAIPYAGCGCRLCEAARKAQAQTSPTA